MTVAALSQAPGPKEHPEWQYLDLLADVLANGVTRDDRTGVGTLGVFGRQMRFDLGQGFPLLTTRTSAYQVDCP